MGMLTPTGGFPTKIAANSTYDSGFIPAVNLNAFAAGVKMDQAGNIFLDRYLDAAGLIEIGAQVTAAVVANTAVAIDIEDGKPCLMVRLRIQNTAGSQANIAAVALVGGVH